MGLRLKLNIILFTVAFLGVAIFAIASTPILNRNAEREVLERAQIMMLSAAGIRKFTAERIAPLLLTDMAKEFHPEAVSSVAATANFDVLRGTFPDYRYREPALNPTNPNNHATDWESDIIRYFRDNPDETELVSQRESPTGPLLNLAQPIIARDSCLACHEKWENAPVSMVSQYGTQNGFGWKAGEIVGAQIVSVPMAVPLENANAERLVFISLFAGVFLLLIVILNGFIHFVILRPVREMTDVAQRVSLGETDVPEYSKRGSDEVSTLARSFNRMRRSMEEALKLLGSPKG